MLKRSLILGAFLMVLAVATASAQEAVKESNLTPRQLLLLQAPGDYELETESGLTWGVVHETKYGPVEYVGKIINSGDVVFIQIVHMLGGDLKSVSMYAVMGLPFPMFTVELSLETGDMEITFQDPGLGVTEEEVVKFLDKRKEEAIAAMKELKVFEDKDLAERIKGLKKAIDSKKAASL